MTVLNTDLLSSQFEFIEKTSKTAFFSKKNNNQTISSSSQLYFLLGLNPNRDPMTIAELVACVEPNVQDDFKLGLEQAFKTGQVYATDVRVKVNETWVWRRIHVAGDQGLLLDIQAEKNAEKVNTVIQVLHNLSNTVSSINVLCVTLINLVDKHEISFLSEIVSMLEKSRPELGHFFTDHPQGKYVLEFLTILSRQVERDKDIVLSDLKLILKYIEQIKDMVLT